MFSYLNVSGSKKGKPTWKNVNMLYLYSKTLNLIVKYNNITINLTLKYIVFRLLESLCVACFQPQNKVDALAGKAA